MGLNLSRLGVALARARGGYAQGQAQREQIDYQRGQQEFDNQRELSREQLGEAYRRDALEANTQLRRDTMAQQMAQQQAAREQRAHELAAAQQARVDEAERQRVFQHQQQQDRFSNASALARLGHQLRGSQQPPMKAVSEAKSGELSVTQGLLKMGTDLREEFGGFVGKGENVTGWIKGRAAPVLQALRLQSGEQTNAQARLANLGSELMKARSGGAITPQEFERLAPFIPSRNDDEVAIQDKLAAFVQALAAIQQEKLTGLEDINRDVGKLKTRYDPEIGALLERSRLPSIRKKGEVRAVAQPVPDETAMSDADLWEAKVGAGMTPQQATAYVQSRKR